MLSSEAVFDTLHIIGRTDPHCIRNLKNEHATQRQGLGGTGIYQMEPFVFWGLFKGIFSECLEEETFCNTLNQLLCRWSTYTKKNRHEVDCIPQKNSVFFCFVFNFIK